MEITKEQLQAEIERHIEIFSRSVGLPYDPPNIFSYFDPKAHGWNYGNAYTMARISILAYQEKENIKTRLKESCITDAQWTWFENESTDTQGFGCVINKSIIIAFRGTESLRDALFDLNVKQTDFLIEKKNTGKVHKGFNKCFESIWEDQVYPFLRLHEAGQEKPIWISGHSLGGALGTLALAKIAFTFGGSAIGGCYTFGQPRVGNLEFKSKVINELGGINVISKKIFRVYQNADPVPIVPRVRYKHISGERCYFTRSGAFKLGCSPLKKWFDRAITYVLILFYFITRGGKLNGFVSDHFSEGYLARIRDAKERFEIQKKNTNYDY